MKEGKKTTFLFFTNDACSGEGKRPGSVIDSLSWLEHGAGNTKVGGSVPMQTVHLRVGFNDPCGSRPTQNTL